MGEVSWPMSMEKKDQGSSWVPRKLFVILIKLVTLRIRREPFLSTDFILLCGG